MSRREKIILAVMGLAVLYGGYTFLGPPSSPSSELASQGSNSAALSSFMLEVAAAMPRLNLNETEKYVIASAITQWGEDPFLRTRMPDREQTPLTDGPQGPEQLSISYSGYIEMGGRRLAILNGREYEVGDPLEIPGYFVKAIYPSRTEIIREGLSGSIVIPLDEMLQQGESSTTAKKETTGRQK